MIDICLTNYSIHSKLQTIFPLFWIHTSKYKIQANERLTKIKKNDQLFNLTFPTFHILHSNGPDKKCHKQKWHVLSHTHQTSVLACARAIARIKWRRLVLAEGRSNFSLLFLTYGRRAFSSLDQWLNTVLKSSGNLSLG